ncbi:MAG: succinate dehydrogenase [Opitutus sp.]|nr:succinate dehydrogenase [Opitutus sp.]
MAQLASSTAPRRFGETSRPDAWWVQPSAVFAGLSAFILYSTWAAFQARNYHHGPYLSPFYSPEIFGDSPHAWFGPKPGWWPSWLPFSPAFFILWIPAGFRMTCYYYRGAYYKSFWADPPACAVGEPRKSYLGENALPLILQNIHRYFLYLALAFLLVLAHDVWKALWFADAAGKVSFGIGVGTLVLAVNVILLSGYTFGCHSLRHLVGGGMDETSRVPACQNAWRCVSCLNRGHLRWAWASLCWVGFSDVYVRLCAMGVWQDLRIL